MIRTSKHGRITWRILKHAHKPAQRIIHVIREAEANGSTAIIETPTMKIEYITSPYGKREALITTPIHIHIKSNDETEISLGHTRLPLNKLPKELQEEIMKHVRTVRKIEASPIKHYDIIIRYA